MITAKPKTSTLFSFSIFAVASAILIYFNASIYFFSKSGQWYNFGILLLLAPVLGYVLYRLLFRLMIIDAGNNQISITYLLTRKSKSYPLNDIIQWHEHVVKVGKTSTYRELELKLAKNKKITIGHKEYTEYEKIIAYLKKKALRKEMKSEK